MVHANRVGGSSPSYKHCLSVLGQFLNQQHARGVTLAEVDTGFMVFYYPDGNYRKQKTLMVSVGDLLEFDGDFLEAARGRKGGTLRNGLSRDRKHPIVPQGYDTVFRALGLKFDQRQATCVTICETPQALYVDYWVANATFVVRDQRRQAISHHQQEIYDTAGIRQLQETARVTLEQESGRHKSSLRVNPHDHLTAMQVAFLLEDDGDYSGAEDIFKRVTSQVPEHVEAQYHHARLAHIRGDKRLALQGVRKAVSLHPEIAAVQDLYGRILQQHGKLADAVVAFEKAVVLDATNPLHHLRLAKAYQAQGRKEEAAAEMAFVSLPHAAPAWEIFEESLLDPPVSATPVVHTPPVPLAALAAKPMAAATAPVIEQEAALAVEEDFVNEESVDPAWTSPMTAGDAQFASAIYSISSSIPLDTPPMSTSFDSVPASPWASSDAQFPTPGASLSAPSLSAALDTSWLEPPAPLVPFDLSPLQPTSTLSERLRASVPPGTGPLAARVPRIIEPEAVQMQYDPPLQASEVEVIEQQLTDFAEPALDFAAGLPVTELAEPVQVAPTIVQQPALTRTAGRPVQAPPEPNGAVEIAAEILTIQRALESEPNRADLHRKLGFLLARQGHAAEAAAEFRRALQCSRMSL